MVVVAALLFAFQSVSVTVGGKDKPKPGDSTARLDSIAEMLEDRARSRSRRDPERPVVRAPVTPELERTAFLDADARTLLLRARDARLKQDTTLLSYDAKAYQRLSVGMGFRAFGRDRLFFRTESATRVRWSRRAGVWVDVTGRRTVLPMVKEAEAEIQDEDMAPIPYYPGREVLWVGSDVARAEVDERELVHPIALGAEAYYRYQTGDSIRFTLPDNRVIRLRELRIIPRRPEWKLSVGSFWFDVETARLVRAAYRFSAPMDIWTVAKEEVDREREEARARGEKWNGDDDVPAWVRGLLSPMQANLEGVTIEYGLYGGRFWMPRSQYAEGWARVGFMRIPFKIEEGFKYNDVNGVDTLPPVPPRRSLADSLFGDTASWRGLSREERRERARLYAHADSIRRAERQAEREQRCKSADTWVRREQRMDGALTVAVRVPCDTTLLAKSPDLPKSIYDEGEELFSSQDRADLMKALNFGLQPGWAPQPPVTEWGFSQTRYNRVEGISTGVSSTMELGGGYALDGSARIGLGDKVPNGALGISRSNGRATWRLGAYQQLSVASDWGAPLSFGSSLGALLWGRDEGFYYRSLGAELERGNPLGDGLSLRLFAERQRTATPTTGWNLSNALGGATEFRPNFIAEKGNAFGAGARDVRTLGLDPDGWRLFSDVRLEGGWFDPVGAAPPVSVPFASAASTGSGESRMYGRVAGDFAISHSFIGPTLLGVTVGAGTSDGAPAQRQYFLGGSHTVRGQLAGTQMGEMYWMTRAELVGTWTLWRPVIFGDIGWAGRKSDLEHPGRPMSGVGIGSSLLDGLIRTDLSRGIYPRKKFRLDVYLEARF